MITVTVYLNEGEGIFFDYEADQARLRKAAEFQIENWCIGADPTLVLNRIYEQLNIGGDMITAEPWTKKYRRDQNRSLSVSDVVVLDDKPFAVQSLGFKPLTWHEVDEGIGRFTRLGSRLDEDRQ